MGLASPSQLHMQPPSKHMHLQALALLALNQAGRQRFHTCRGHERALNGPLWTPAVQLPEARPQAQCARLRPSRSHLCEINSNDELAGLEPLLAKSTLDLL